MNLLSFGIIKEIKRASDSYILSKYLNAMDTAMKRFRDNDTSVRGYRRTR
jgi:hypothetical protein